VQRVQRGEAGSRSQSLWGDEIETSLIKRVPTEADAERYVIRIQRSFRSGKVR
jgi:hypothetical protein